MQLDLAPSRLSPKPTTHHAVRSELAADPDALLAVFLGPAPPAEPTDPGLADGALAPPPLPPRTPAAAARVINRAGQRELQALFQQVYATPTFSNNNNWLKARLLGREFFFWPIRVA